MCMQDVRIGRATRTTTKIVRAINTTANLLLPYNPDRYSLYITASTNQPSIIFPSIAPVNPADFGSLARVAPDVLVDIQHNGDMVIQPWYCLPFGGDIILMVVETVLQEQ